MKSVLDPAVMSVAVSTVIFAMRRSDDAMCLSLPLVRRTRAPFEGRWALPGGWVAESESLETASARTLRETTGLQPSYLEQLYTFGHPARSKPSPEGRVVSVVYSALVRADEVDVAAEHDNVEWFNVAEVPDLAFDHNEIVEYALWRLRNKVEYGQIAFFFLGETFALSQLREVFEEILQRKLDPANFRRRVELTGTIVATKQRLKGGRHRPPLLYRCSPAVDPQSKGPAA